MEAQGEIVEGADELGGVDRSPLQGGEDLARGKQDGGAADPLDERAAQARDAHLQPPEVLHRVDLLAAPAEGPRRGLRHREGDDAETGLELVPERLPAAMVDSGRLLLRGHAERHGEEHAEGRMLAVVEDRGVVAHLGRAVHRRVHAAKRGDEFARGERARPKPPAGHRLDGAGEAFDSDPHPRQAVWPGVHEPPFDDARAIAGAAKGAVAAAPTAPSAAPCRSLCLFVS